MVVYTTIFGGKGWLSDLINHEAVCRTAPATPGLLKRRLICWTKKYVCVVLLYAAFELVRIFMWIYLRLNFILLKSTYWFVRSFMWIWLRLCVDMLKGCQWKPKKGLIKWRIKLNCTLFSNIFLLLYVMINIL